MAVLRQAGTYHFRRQIPPRFQAIFKKSEYWQTLTTCNRAQTVAKAGLVNFNLQEAFNMLDELETRIKNQKEITDLPHRGRCKSTTYAACPTVRYAENGYYIFDLSGNGTGPFITAMARINDFINIQAFGGNSQYTAYQQLLAPDGNMDGINASDVDLVEWNGKFYPTYLIGDQSTWVVANDASYDGMLLDLYRELWP